MRRFRRAQRRRFCDSKQLVEELGVRLRELGVTTHLIHASLSLDERHRAERAFAEGRDCVIVSTSALELGLDVGDLDRVIQLNAPPTVAAFLQRLGRSGRRPGTRRNCLFLALGEEQLLTAAGLLQAWSQGFVEPVLAPPEPRHITAQQLLALCLQEGRVGAQTWPKWLPLPSLTGHRHFMNLMAVFTASPEFTCCTAETRSAVPTPLFSPTAWRRHYYYYYYYYYSALPCQCLSRSGLLAYSPDSVATPSAAFTPVGWLSAEATWTFAGGPGPGTGQTPP